MNLLYDIWLYLGFAMLGALGFFLWSNKNTLTKREKLVGLLVMTFPFHMFEERIFPGGFAWIYGQMTGMTQTKTVVLCNILILAFMAWLFIKKRREPWALMLLCVLGIGEFCLHTVFGIRSMQLFGEQGLAFPYSPGWATAFALMVPLSVLGIQELVQSRALNRKTVGKTLLMMVIVAGLMVGLPNKLLSGIGPEYGSGFYEAFLR